MMKKITNRNLKILSLDNAIYNIYNIKTDSPEQVKYYRSINMLYKLICNGDTNLAIWIMTYAK